MGLQRFIVSHRRVERRERRLGVSLRGGGVDGAPRRLSGPGRAASLSVSVSYNKMGGGRRGGRGDEGERASSSFNSVGIFLMGSGWLGAQSPLAGSL